MLFDNSEKWLTVIFEPTLCQQSASEVFYLLQKLLDQSEIPLQESKPFVTDHFAEHSMIPKHQGFRGQFHHLIEHHRETMNKEQNKI